jgi:hypothetical protein
MDVDRDGLWLLIAVCCAGALVFTLPRMLRHEFYARHARWREAPVRFAGVSLSAALTAAAIGMGVAFGVLALDIALIRLLG